MKRLSQITGLFFLYVVAGHASDQAARPPEFFVDKGACPGECCSYTGAWLAAGETVLHEQPSRKSKVVGHVKTGERVAVETGQVQTKAGKFVVTKESRPYRPGDVLWVYTYLGEGWYRVWFEGEMLEEE